MLKKGWGKIFLGLDYLYCAVRHGCLIHQYVYGNFHLYNNRTRKKIMTYRRLCKLINICNNPSGIKDLDNKVEFNKKFAKWVNRKWLYSKDMTFEQFAELYDSADCVIVKPINDYEGNGIKIINKNEYQNSTFELFNDFRYKNLIIEEFFKQNPKMVLDNKSVNTIRINTVVNEKGSVYMFKAVLRAGVGDSVVDNYNAGGVEYPIDIETGIISSLGYYNGQQKCVFHPGTSLIMPGYIIPMWEKVIATVEDAAKIAKCRFIGWDVAIGNDGIELIEGNHNPGYVCMEYFGEIGWYNNIKKHL